MLNNHLWPLKLVQRRDLENKLSSHQKDILNSCNFVNYLEVLFAIELLRAGVENFEFEKEIYTRGSNSRAIDFYFPKPIKIFFVEGLVQNVEIKQSSCDRGHMRDQHAQLAGAGHPTVIFEEREIIFCQTWGLLGNRIPQEFTHKTKPQHIDGKCNLCERYKKRVKKKRRKQKKQRDKNSKRRCKS